MAQAPIIKHVQHRPKATESAYVPSRREVFSYHLMPAAGHGKDASQDSEKEHPEAKAHCLRIAFLWLATLWASFGDSSSLLFALRATFGYVYYVFFLL